MKTIHKVELRVSNKRLRFMRYLKLGAFPIMLFFMFSTPDADAGSAGPVAGCSVFDPEPPPYYQIELVTTRRVPGAGLATGVGEVTYKATPFGIAVGPDGSYAYNLDIRVEKMQPARNGNYVAWVTTPDISNIKRLGPLDALHQIKGEVSWNKFLVVISLESDLSEKKTKWKGPVVLRGLSRSGFMHTMAGHGPYENEPCAVYGY